ncbi:hypothetical protein ZIOFF_008172 [Zingiber officinale]|uniref:Uncharacterized protein n=1 Tax=Zingiber officinale TaxID=94328 RepID=A0A8J5IFY2_ZINOF|nr:hypothetical protein ZIOFF_008172 [Zingiber officinale]
MPAPTVPLTSQWPRGPGSSGVDMAADAERRKAQVATVHVHVDTALHLHEALGLEGLGLISNRLFLGDVPHVHHGGGSRGDDHAIAEVDVACGEVDPGEERVWRVGAEGLLEHGLQERHPHHVNVCCVRSAHPMMTSISRRSLACVSGATPIPWPIPLAVQSWFPTDRLNPLRFQILSLSLGVSSSNPSGFMAVPGPYSGVSTLAFVARASALTFGVVYGSFKLSYLKHHNHLHPIALVSCSCGSTCPACEF